MELCLGDEYGALVKGAFLDGSRDVNTRDVLEYGTMTCLEAFLYLLALVRGPWRVGWRVTCSVRPARDAADEMRLLRSVPGGPRRARVLVEARTPDPEETTTVTVTILGLAICMKKKTESLNGAIQTVCDDADVFRDRSEATSTETTCSKLFCHTGLGSQHTVHVSLDMCTCPKRVAASQRTMTAVRSDSYMPRTRGMP